MRKKVLFLFAFVFTLSAMPMHLFSQVPQSALPQPLSIDIPLGALQGMATSGEYGLFIDIVLGGGGSLGDRRFCGATSGEITLLDAGLSNIEPHSIRGHNSGVFNPDELGFSCTYRMFIVYSTSPGAIIPLNVNGVLRVTLENVLVDHPQAEIGVRAVGLRGGVPMDFWVVPMFPVVMRPREGCVTFDIDGSPNFSHMLALYNISVHENVFGNFCDDLAVRLEAPAFFRWAADGFNSAQGVELSTTGGSVFAKNTGTHTVRRIENVDGLDRDVLYIPIALASRGSGAMAEMVHIKNLLLLPESRAGNGLAEVHVSTVTELPRLGSSPSGSIGGRLTNRPDNEDSTRRTAVLNAGYRICENKSIEFITLDHVPAVRSGYLGLYSREPDDLRGVKTATVELRELAPGAWGVSGGAPVDFTFNQQGITVIGATAQAGWDENRTNIFDQSTMWINRTDCQWEEAYGNIHLSPTQVSITIPRMPESYFDNPNNLRALRVTFYLSVEAGFETRYDGEYIYVTAEGAGIKQLTENTIPVARPSDPISVNLPHGSTGLMTDEFRQVANQKLSDLEITIHEPHKLHHGSEIWVYAAGDDANHNLGLNISANQRVISSNPNLQLGSGRWVSKQTGVFGFGAIAFPITRVPQLHEAPEPITLTIEGIHVTGSVIPDVDYYVIVSGSAIAENNHTIFTNRLDIDPFGTFAGLPYAVLIHDSTPPQNSDITISRFDSISGVVGEPIIFREIENADVGFVSVRAFASLMKDSYILPNTPTPDTHTIVGTDTSGNQVSVSMQSNSPTAIVHVDGYPHPVDDIAAWAGAISGVPYGQLKTLNIDGNLFIPYRAVANMFGYDVKLADAYTILFAPLA